MKFLGINGKKGIETETMIKAVIYLIVLFIIVSFIILGKIPAVWEGPETAAQDISDLWNKILGKETSEEKKFREKSEKEFLNFYDKYLEGFSKCFGSKNYPCYCNFSDFEEFSEGYSILLETRGEEGYRARVFREIEGKAKQITNTKIYEEPESVFFYIDRTGSDTVSIYREKDSIVFKGQYSEQRFLIKGGVIYFYKPNKGTISVSSEEEIQGLHKNLPNLKICKSD